MDRKERQMNRKKGFRLGMLLVCLMMCMAGAGAEDLFIYERDGNGVMVTGYTGNETYVAVPETLGGREVTGIGREAFAYAGMKEVLLPGSVQKIGDRAFYRCTDLEKAYLSEGVVEVGEGAFSDCVKLMKITLPGGLRTLSKHAFRNCAFLSAINLPDSLAVIGEGAFEGAWLVQADIPGGVSEIGANAFAHCLRLSTVKLQEGVRQIGPGAFSECVSLKSVSLPESLQSVGTGAFSQSGLTEIRIASECRIEQDAFQGTRLRLVEGIAGTEAEQTASMSGAAFQPLEMQASDTVLYDGTGIGYQIQKDGVKIVSWEGDEETVQIPDKIQGVPVTFIGKETFKGRSMKKVMLPATLKRIGSNAFAECRNLQEIEFPEGLEQIGKQAFFQCKALKKVTLPASLKRLRMSAFHAAGIQELTIRCVDLDAEDMVFALCQNLKKVELPYGMKVILYGMFMNCSGLKEIDIPETVEEIGMSVFAGCRGLEEIRLPDSVRIIDSLAFSGMGKVRIEIPSSVESIDSSAFDRTEATIVCEEGSYAFRFAQKRGLKTETLVREKGNREKQEKAMPEPEIQRSQSAENGPAAVFRKGAALELFDRDGVRARLTGEVSERDLVFVELECELENSTDRDIRLFFWGTANGQEIRRMMPGKGTVLAHETGKCSLGFSYRSLNLSGFRELDSAELMFLVEKSEDGKTWTELFTAGPVQLDFGEQQED